MRAFLLAILWIAPTLHGHTQETSAPQALAERIAQSTLADRISPAQDEEQRLRDIRTWIRANPDTAAKVGRGLAEDDARGDHRFENALDHASRKHLVARPSVINQIFNRFKKDGKEDNNSDEEQSALFKTMFEGESGSTSTLLMSPEGPNDFDATPKQTRPSNTAVRFGTSFYDRLSGANLTGYSPQVLAIQNELNFHRAPGMPKLMETGRLDYPTLIYPAYGMNYDIDGMQKRLRTAGSHLDEQKAALEKARIATAAFVKTAEPVKNGRVTRALLSQLAAHRREAARWITIAALEEELSRLEDQAHILTPELQAAVASCRVEESAKTAYLQRGRRYEEALAQIKANTQAAIAALESNSWQTTTADVERALAANTALRRGLNEHLRDFTNTPFRLAALSSDKPAWRVWLENLIMRWLPGTSYARRLRAQRDARAQLTEAFIQLSSQPVRF